MITCFDFSLTAFKTLYLTVGLGDKTIYVEKMLSLDIDL